RQTRAELPVYAHVETELARAGEGIDLVPAVVWRAEIERLGAVPELQRGLFGTVAGPGEAVIDVRVETLRTELYAGIEPARPAARGLQARRKARIGRPLGDKEVGEPLVVALDRDLEPVAGR